MGHPHLRAPHSEMAKGRCGSQGHWEKCHQENQLMAIVVPNLDSIILSCEVINVLPRENKKHFIKEREGERERRDRERERTYGLNG